MPLRPGLGRAIDLHDATAGLGMINVMSDLRKYTIAGRTLYVFALFE
jgi:hypothetical protein